MLGSLKTSIEEPIASHSEESGKTSPRMAALVPNPDEEPESEDEVAASPEKEGTPRQVTNGGALEDKVPAVKVDGRGHAYLTECDVVFPKRDTVHFPTLIHAHFHETPITQTGRALENFKAMRTIRRETEKTNTVRCISRKHFLSLDYVQRSHLMERPFVIASDVPNDESPCVQNSSPSS
jgi:hypothetical protein